MISLMDLTREDLEAVVRWRNDPVVSRHLADRMKSMDTASVWFKTVRSNPKVWLKAILLDGRLIGYGAVESIDEENRKCELALVIGESECWGAGIGATVLRQMLAYAFDDLHMHRVWAVATGGNDRSQRLVTGAGFVHEGTMRETLIIDGSFTDLLCYSILEDEYRRLYPAESGEGKC